ncbi:MAG: hypothetical protein ACHREM_07250 [Polyangiales bacterium]
MAAARVGLRSSFGVVALFTMVASIGCAPTAEKVCEHQAELASAAKELGANYRTDRCLSGLGELKKKSRKEYECVAKCVLAAKLYDDVDTCHQLCSPDGPSLGGKSSKGLASAKASATTTASEAPVATATSRPPRAPTTATTKATTSATPTSTTSTTKATTSGTPKLSPTSAPSTKRSKG